MYLFFGIFSTTRADAPTCAVQRICSKIKIKSHACVPPKMRSRSLLLLSDAEAVAAVAAWARGEKHKRDEARDSLCHDDQALHARQRAEFDIVHKARNGTAANGRDKYARIKVLAPLIRLPS